MVYLHMSVDSAKATGCLVKASGGEYPKGLAQVVQKNLQKKYVKIYIFLASKWRQKMHILNLKRKGGPNNFFEEIAIIQIQDRKFSDDTISERDICSKIIIAEPKMCMPVLITLYKEKESNL